jgi:cell division protein ZapE
MNATPHHNGPIEAYQAAIAAGDIQADPAQAETADLLQLLHDQLEAYAPQKPSRLHKLFGRKADLAPKGLYLYGGVGRGKSMLMDLFFDTTTFEPRRRVHFHAFMLEVHQSNHRWRAMSEDERQKSGDDPIRPLATRIASEAKLLCFDEFHVTDVADAMILGRLFEALFDEGVVIVLTSNRAPDELYVGGLNRSLFLPSIEMLKTRLDVRHLQSPTDYRLERIKGMPVYHCPLDERSANELDVSFKALTDVEIGEAQEIAVQQGRTLKVSEAAKGVARFTFEELCARPLGAADYLAIAEHFHTIVLADIPQMDRDKRNEAKRFVTLIDALYDNHTKLVCSAAARPEDLYPSGDGSFEFSRTASRLIEMQSHDYFEAAEVGME